MSGCSCSCGNGKLKLIFACSGASDVGEIADRVARKLNREGSGRMFCPVGIGGRVSGIIESTKAADMILAVEGCPLQCVTKSLELAGFKGFRQLRLWEFGLKKGNSPVTDETIERIAAEARKLLSE